MGEIVSFSDHISSKEIAFVKALRLEDKLYELSHLMYGKREHLLGDIGTSDLDQFLSKIPTSLDGWSRKPLLFFALEIQSPPVLK